MISRGNERIFCVEDVECPLKSLTLYELIIVIQKQVTYEISDWNADL